MYQSGGGSFRKRESLSYEFTHSCFGRLVILGAILGVLSIILAIFCPSEERMRTVMEDDIRQCINAHDSINGDWMDNALNNFSYMFTTADTISEVEMYKLFKKNNRLEYNDHTIFATMSLCNNFRPDGVRCGIGILGVVIPTIHYNDFLLVVGSLRKDYNQPIIENNAANNQDGATVGDSTIEGEVFGENPDFGGVFEYHAN